MNVDTTRIAEQINAFWSAHGYAVIIGTGLVALVLVVVGLVKAVRSPQRDRWVSGLAAVVVLAWTSEGLWEVGRYALGLPVGFAVMTFFVFEAMMLSSALQAEQHRRGHGTPGPAGRYVWVLAACTATVVAVNAATLVEALLRFVLPLAAAGLWWVGITAARDEDAEDVRQAREREAARRAATWAVTPRTLLVGLGIMRPGVLDVTDAERERRVRRMVVAADRLHNAIPGGWHARRAAARLRRLARLATESDVAEVRARVRRTAGIVALITPISDTSSGSGRPDEARVLSPSWAAPQVGTAASPASGSSRDGGPRAPDGAAKSPPSGATPLAVPVANLAPLHRTAGATQPAGASRSRTTAHRQSTAELVAKAAAKRPDASKAEVAARLGVSERTVQRYWPSSNGHHTQDPNEETPATDYSELPVPSSNNMTNTSTAHHNQTSDEDTTSSTKPAHHDDRK